MHYSFINVEISECCKMKHFCIEDKSSITIHTMTHSYKTDTIQSSVSMGFAG